MGINHRFDACIQESDLFIEVDNDFFDALLDGLLVGLLQPVFFLRSLITIFLPFLKREEKNSL